MNGNIQRMLFVALVVFLLVILGFSLKLVLPVYYKYSDMESQLQSLKSEYDRIHGEKLTLIREVHDLEHNIAAAEKVAREKYNLCREGERILIYKQ